MLRWLPRNRTPSLTGDRGSRQRQDNETRDRDKKTGQRNWELKNFEFYVLMPPDKSITMFCLDRTVRLVTMEELRDLLLLNLPNTSFVQRLSFIRGKELLQKDT